MVEITTRTTGGRLLLRPCPELNERILGILGRALALYPVSLHAFVFLSNHWHALATVDSAQRIASFVGYVNGNIAKAVRDVHGWSERVWSRRAQIIPVVDDGAAEGRLRYILSHGVKEGLVSSPVDWPGVSSARALAFGEDVTGTWRSRTVRSSRAAGDQGDQVYAVELTPIPSYAALSKDQRRRRILAMIASEVDSRKKQCREVLGVDMVVTQHPFSKPRSARRRAAPFVHAACEEMRQQFRTAKRNFVAAFRAASRVMLTAGLGLAATFPAGALPPRLPASPCEVVSMAAGDDLLQAPAREGQTDVASSSTAQGNDTSPAVFESDDGGRIHSSPRERHGEFDSR